jgi:hypothetical protein
VDYKIIRESAADSEFQYWDSDYYAECYFDFCRCESCRVNNSREMYRDSRAKYRKSKAKWLNVCHKYPIFRKFTLSQIISLSELNQIITGYNDLVHYRCRFKDKMIFTLDCIKRIQHMTNMTSAQLNEIGDFNEKYFILKMREISSFLECNEYINDITGTQVYFTGIKEKSIRVQSIAEAKQKYAAFREFYHSNPRVYFPTIS